MAVIQKIRNTYGKIAGGIIAVALVSFIISDARNGSFGGLFGGRKTHIMTVNGTKIESKDYEQRVKEYETLTTIFSNRGPLDDAGRAQIREQVLQSVAYETIVEGICDKLGINTSEQENKDLIYSPNAHPLVKQFQINGEQIFNNPETKQFDPGRVKGFEEQLAKDGKKIDPYGKFLEDWTSVKNYVLRMSRIDKFNTMLAASVYSPLYEAKRGADNQNMMASIRYVKVPYTTVADNEVKVTDDDIKAFMQKHKAMFESEQASRTIDYVSFDIIPASADTARAVNALLEIKDEFSKTKDNQTFVGSHSDDAAIYSEAYVSTKAFASRYADTIMSQATGSIYGPYLENGSYRLTKVVDKKVLPDSAKVRHILIKISEGGKDILPDSIAKRRIDSIETAIRGGANFDTMLIKYSDDGGSKDKHGEYWFTLQQRPGISKTFGDFAFEGKTGEKKVVKADNSKVNGYVGYHYIEVLDQKGSGPVMQLATITKILGPSDSTANAILGVANDFAAKSATAAEFDANLKKAGMDKRVGDNIKESSFSIQGLGSARDVIKWMYTHKLGEVSSNPFKLGEQRYVVAKLTAIDAKGMMGINSANRPMLEQRVKDEKKAEAIAKKFAGQSLDAIAQATAQTVGQSDSVIYGGSVVPGLGYEPKVIGYAFCASLQPNTVSPGIKGQGGVYFISLNGRTTKPVDPMQMQGEVMMQRRNQEGQTRNYVGQMLQQSFIKTADIKYNIDNF